MKIDINKLRLKWKIFAFLLGFCALLLIILWLFQMVFLDSFYRSIKVMETKNNAKTIINNIDNENLSDLITSISQNSDVCIEVVSANGMDLYSADVLRDCVIHKMPLPDKLRLISDAQTQGGELYEYIYIRPPQKPNKNGEFIGNIPPNNMGQMQSIVYVKSIQNGTGDALAILVDSVISPINATVTTLRYQLYFITGIMLLLSMLLSLIIAKRVSKPIEEINKSAKVLAMGSYDTHFVGKGFLEIGELSDTLNTTATELSKVEALRRELLANISHDLRTPLSLIYSYAEMMHDFPHEITPEQTQIVMNETQRLTTLVNDVLDISKFETRTQQLSVSEFNITKSIKSTTERIAELIKKDGYQLSFAYDEEVWGWADEVKIIQAFYNLLINAINYTGIDKTIEVRQVIVDGNVRIEVSDTGEGIAEENLPYIWDRYYKADKKHKRAVTGTGLGLSIVKKVIELHGGNYGVESQVGKGSIFWFSLKLTK